MGAGILSVPPGNFALTEHALLRRACSCDDASTSGGDATMSFQGSCHCGAISYTVEEDPPTKAIECNCTICRRKGYLHHFTAPEKFTFKGSRDDLQVYTFNHHAIRHQSCKKCGCAPFAEGSTPDGKAMVEINLRCMDGLDLSTLSVTQYDGASR